MIDEQQEFSISQYVDGTLNDADRATLERWLENDSDTRATLSAYRKLNLILKSEAGLPEIQWDAFARSISAAVDAAQGEHEEKIAERFRIPRWVRTIAVPMAMAASVLIMTGVGIHAMWMGSRNANTNIAIHTHPAPEAAFASISVFGSQTEPSQEPGDMQVAIGPSNDAKDEPIVVHYSGDLVSRSSHVSVASGVTPVHDTDSLSFDMQ